MSRIPTIIAGLVLILLGGLMLACNATGSILGIRLPELLQLWPLVVASAGLMFVLPPLVWPQSRGLGALFIPGAPILAVSGVGLLTNFLPVGRVWGTFWPLIILGVAMGLGLAALYLRVIWLMIPAFVVGLLGAALQFSAFTGWWSAWAILWVVAPLGGGLALLIIGAGRRSRGLFIGGLFVSGSALGIAMCLGVILTRQWTIAGGVMGIGLMAIGVALVGRSLLSGQLQRA